MPNHDTTRLVITAPEDPEALAKFVTKYRDIDAYADIVEPGTIDRWTEKPMDHRYTEPCLSHAFMPRPIEYMGLEDGAAACDWGNRHWGTKWGTYRESHEVGEDRIVITFDSAWAPPYQLLEALAVAYPAITIEGTTVAEYDDILRRFTITPGESTELEEIGRMHEYFYSDTEEYKITHYRLDGAKLDPPEREDY